MLRAIAIPAVLALAVVDGGCEKCVPGDLNAPRSCAPLSDAGSPDCAATQACVVLTGTGKANDFRCLEPCQSGSCPSGQICQPTAVGTACGQPFDEDAGTRGDCRTIFLCRPDSCQ